MKKIFLLTITILLSTPLMAEDVLYCSSQLVTGLIKKDGHWKNEEFKPHRFIVKVEDQFKTIVIEDELYNCENPYPNTREHFHICNETYGFSFRYSTETKKFVFIQSSSFGYVVSNNDTDSVSAGKCEKF